MLKKIILLFSVLLVLIVALVLFQGKNAEQSTAEDLHEVDLQLQMKEGDIFRFTQREEIDLKEAGKGMFAAKRKFWVELDYTIKCLEVLEDGSMMIEQRWDAARAEGAGKGGRIDWDTEIKDKRATPPDMKRYYKLVGKWIKVQVTPEGEILNLWNPDVIAKALLYEKGVKVNTMEDDDPELEMMMDRVWESKEHVLECAWRSYPEKTLTASEEWRIEAPAATMRAGLQVTKLTFNQVRNGLAQFDVVLSARVGTDPTDGDFFGTIESKIDAWAQGEMEMDVSTGLIAKATVSGDTRMEAQIEDRLWDIKYEKNMEGKISKSLRQIP